MEQMKKIGLKVLDFVEIVMPVISLTVIFLSFVVNVFARYVFHSPVNASYELCLIGLFWCLMLSAPYAARTNSHVAFTLLYDAVNPTGQLIFRMVGNAFMIFCLGVMLYPCYDWVMFMQRKVTAVLKIKMSLVFFPFVVFNLLTLCHMAYDFAKDVKLLARVLSGKEKLEKKHMGAVGYEGEDEEVNA